MGRKRKTTDGPGLGNANRSVAAPRQSSGSRGAGDSTTKGAAAAAPRDPAKQAAWLRSPWTRRWAAAIIVVAGVAAYANSLNGPFIFDDTASISQTPRIQRLWPPWAPMVETTRPVVLWSFAVNYAFGRLDVRGYHAVNLAIHLAAGLTLFGLVRRTLVGHRLAARYGDSAAGLALAVALLWTLHPLQTESVTYVVQRMESLMGLFYLLTLYCFVRASDSRESSRRQTAAGLWYAASVVCCALGMGTKEVMVTAPVMVLWYDRVFVAGSWKEMLQRRWPYYAALAGTWAVVGALIAARGEDYTRGGVLVIKGLTFWQYALSQPGVILHYLKLSLWPQGLCLDYGWPMAATPDRIVPPLVAVGVLAAATVWCMFRQPAWGFVGGWFFAILAPTSSVLPVIDLAYEHRMYLPLAAVATVVVLGGYAVGRAVSRRGWLPPRAAIACGVCLVATAGLVLGGLTWQRNADYASELPICEDMVAKAPHNARAHYHLGMVLQGQGELDEAISHYQQALAINPNHPKACNNLGLIWLDEGRTEAAMALFSKALQVNADDPEAQQNLGVALGKSGRGDEAIAHFEKALEVSPTHAKAHYHLGLILQGQRKFDEAIVHYRQALESDSEYVNALNNLAWVLATCPRDSIRNGAEALALAQQAVKLSEGRDPNVLDTLAAAYAEMGQFPEALRTTQEALRLATSQNDTALAETLRSRLKLYESRTPLRE